jgi:hypothetical protein
MNATFPAQVTSISNIANDRMRRAMNLALAEIFRLEGRATVVAVEVVSERPVLTIDQPIALPGAHYITRSIDGRRSTVWVAQDGGCQIECDSPQPLPAVAGRR